MAPWNAPLFPGSALTADASRWDSPVHGQTSTHQNGAVPITPARAVLLSAGPGFGGMFVLFAVLPVLGAQSLGTLGAGLTTTVFMITTVITQVFVPYLQTRIRPWLLMFAALALLGVPAVIYLWDLPAWLLLAATAVRGIGFGLITIVSVSLAAHYAAPERQGAAQGALGLVTSLAGVVSPGVGLWLLENIDRSIPVGLGVGLPLLGLAFLAPIYRQSKTPISPRIPRGESRPVPVHWLVFMPAVVFLPSAIVYGALYTFMPLESAVAPAALIAVGAGYVLGRTTGGRLADRFTMPRVLIPATVVGALAIAALGMTESDVLDIVMSGVLGLAIGAGATASLTGMLRSVDPSRIGLVSMAWNITFDAGILLSGLLFGVIVATAGFPTATLVIAAWLAAMAVLGVATLRRRIPSSPAVSNNSQQTISESRITE
jgi:MFS family permease